MYGIYSGAIVAGAYVMDSILGIGGGGGGGGALWARATRVGAQIELKGRGAISSLNIGAPKLTLNLGASSRP